MKTYFLLNWRVRRLFSNDYLLVVSFEAVQLLLYIGWKASIYYLRTKIVDAWLQQKDQSENGFEMHMSLLRLYSLNR